jgi:hypothetical protein
MTVFPAGEVLSFIAQRPAQVFGRRYKAGKEVLIELTQDWDEEDGLGEGGPWGWGGYTSWTLRRIGRIPGPEAFYPFRS